MALYHVFFRAILSKFADFCPQLLSPTFGEFLSLTFGELLSPTFANSWGQKFPKEAKVRDKNCKTVPKEIAQKHGRETC